MKKLLVCSLALVGMLAFGDIAAACTATGVYDRATRMEDTEIYDTIKDVIETDTVIQQEDWQNPQATHAAVGTVLREAVIRDHAAGNSQAYSTTGERLAYDRYVDTAGKVRGMLNEPNGYKYDRHTHLNTVRDHVIMHGNDWEDGTNGANGNWTQPRPVTPPPPPPPIDHAG